MITKKKIEQLYILIGTNFVRHGIISIFTTTWSIHSFICYRVLVFSLPFITFYMLLGYSCVSQLEFRKDDIQGTFIFVFLGFCFFLRTIMLVCNHQHIDCEWRTEERPLAAPVGYLIPVPVDYQCPLLALSCNSLFIYLFIFCLLVVIGKTMIHQRQGKKEI